MIFERIQLNFLFMGNSGILSVKMHAYDSEVKK